MVNVLSPGPRLVAEEDSVLAEAETLQGLWTQDQYLAVTNVCKRLIEFTDGHIELLPWPTTSHQAVSRFLFFALHRFVNNAGGEVFFAPLRLRLREGKFREPDLLLLRDAKDPRNQNAYWLGADLVMEVVSPDNPSRDLVTKRNDYAEAGIPEYWIVNPLNETITVLTLHGDEYLEHGVFGRGETADGIVLRGFSADVSDTFDAGDLP